MAAYWLFTLLFLQTASPIQPEGEWLTGHWEGTNNSQRQVRIAFTETGVYRLWVDDVELTANLIDQGPIQYHAHYGKFPLRIDLYAESEQVIISYLFASWDDKRKQMLLSISDRHRNVTDRIWLKKKT